MKVLQRISTHALTEGDIFHQLQDSEKDISTHALTEGDDIFHQLQDSEKEFQLTPSRRATS